MDNKDLMTQTNDSLNSIIELVELAEENLQQIVGGLGVGFGATVDLSSSLGDDSSNGLVAGLVAGLV